MNKHRTLSIATLLVSMLFLISSCDDQPAPAPTFNPGTNNSSELAVFMRQMYDDAADMKTQIQQGDIPETALDYDQLTESEGTEPDKVNSAAYELFSESFLLSLEQLENCEPHAADSVYTVMVQSCEACHRSMCPGPLKRIRKLHAL